MAPKRSAPTRPPPSPVASSEETASGSGTEEEEEEEIGNSPPAAAPKSIASPPQKDQEPEASDEDEDEGEEAEEEDEEEDDDAAEEEEEDEKANRVIPSSATKNPHPPPQTHEESETSGEEEEDDDDEMPQTKPAPNQEVEANGAKRPRAPFERTWSIEDELRILEALAAYRREHGTLPQTDVLAEALAGKLDNSGYSLSKLQQKVKSLHSQYNKAVRKGVLPSKDHDRRLFDLSKNVWPSVTKAVADGGAGREPDEMCELYPYLAEEVKALQKAYPGMFKREFTMIDDSKARALDGKIKRQRFTRMKLHLRGHDLIKEVTKTLMDLAE